MELKEKRIGVDILEINEEELCRIILDIHDGPVQDMYAALSQIDALQKKLEHLEGETGLDREAIQSSLTQIAALIEQALWEIKNFIGVFRPPEFQTMDLLSILKALIIQHEDFTGSRVELEASETLPSVSVPVKIALYRILQEALSNAYRHAGTDRQYVRLYPKDGGVCMEVRDEGVGFDVNRVLARSKTNTRSPIGLRGMQHRVALVGGTIHIESRPGHGTRISVWVPCHEEKP